MRLGLHTVLLVVACAPAIAQDAVNYPSKPVRVILGFAPGGSTDIQSRLFSQKVAETLRQPFIVENRPSAGGSDALALVAKSPPDGYMLLAASATFSVAPAFSRNLPADPVKDFAPITLMTKAPYLLVVHPTVPTKSVRELIALAKAKPGQLNFGGSPIGTANHLAPLWLFSLANIKVVYVPYNGTGPSVTALIGGHVDALMGNTVSLAPHVKAGRLRALGVTSAKRSTIMPELPTIAENGVPGYDFITFFGWVAAANTPPAIINKLSAEFARAVKSPELADRIRGEGAEAVGSTPEEFRQLIAAEVPRWRKVVQDAGIKVE